MLLHHENTVHSKLSTETLVGWTDLALVTWIIEQQPQRPLAFDVLANRYRTWIFKRCYFRLGNSHDAEDITQEVMLRAFRNIDQLQDKKQLRAWLKTIIDNSCNTFAVRRARYTTIEHIEQLIEVHEQEELKVPQEMFAECEAVRDVLTLMPTRAQQVLQLRFYCDCSLEEIANILSLTLSATKARLYRAIEQFAQIYTQRIVNNSQYQ